MSDKIAELHRRIINPTIPTQVWAAEVTAVQAHTCTVRLLGSGLTVADVRLRADADSDPQADGVLVVPRKGSVVLVGLVQNELADLYVCGCSEVDKVVVTIAKTTVTVDKAGVNVVADKLSATVTADKLTAKRSDVELTLSDGVLLKQGPATVEVKGGKVSVKNAGASLADLIDSLASLLQTYQVTCAAPGAPSAPFPASVTQAVQIQTKAKLLLS